VYGRPIHIKECGLTARAHDIETVSFTIYFAATGVGKIIMRVYCIIRLYDFADLYKNWWVGLYYLI